MFSFTMTTSVISPHSVGGLLSYLLVCETWEWKRDGKRMGKWVGRLDHGSLIYV